MSNPGLFADLFKTQRDVLQKGFASDLNVEVTARPSTVPVTVATTLNRKASGDVDGNISAKYVNKEHGLDVKATLDTAKPAKIDLGHSGLVDGLSLKFTGQPTKDFDSKVVAEYQRPSFSFAGSATVPDRVVTGGVVVGSGSWRVGAETVFNAGTDQGVKAVNAGIAYDSTEIAVGTFANWGQGKTRTLDVGGNFFRPRNSADGFDVAGEVVYDTTRQSAAVRSTIGVQFNPVSSPSTLVKAKVDNAGVVTASAKYELSPGSALTLSASVEATKLNGGTHKFGISYTFTD